MANWSKLNAKFDEVINGITDTEWYQWEAERKQKKTLRKTEIAERARVQEIKIKST